MDDHVLGEVPVVPRSAVQSLPIDEELVAMFARRRPKVGPMPVIAERGGDEPPAPPTTGDCTEPPNDRDGAMTGSEYVLIEFWPELVQGREMTLHVIRRNASRFLTVLRESEAS